MRRPYIFLILLGMLLAQACEEPDCVYELSDTVGLSFYKQLENELDTVYVNKISVVGTDSIVLEKQDSVSKVQLHLAPDTSAVTFVFNVRGYGIDTLTLTYKNGARLISEECGIELVYSDLGYSRSDFDSIRVVNTILAEAIDEDIRVYNN